MLLSDPEPFPQQTPDMALKETDVSVEIWDFGLRSAVEEDEGDAWVETEDASTDLDEALP